MDEKYIEHGDRAVVVDNRFQYVMALTLNPATHYRDGVIRCITSREGDVSVSGYIDRSELHTITGTSFEKFEIGEKLSMRNEAEVMHEILEDGMDFLGFEDPDIWIDEKTNTIHLYFTIPLFSKNGNMTKIHLGHAFGKDLHSLEMTRPVLMADELGGAKELCLAPLNKKGFRYNLVESSDNETGAYSTVRVAIAHDMEKEWEFGKTVFHPAKHNIPWIAGHASPGPLFPGDFIYIGEGKRLGLMNGREANKTIDGKTTYGTFSVGLFIYDYENGKIEWVSAKPFIQDSEARTITFASQFVEIGKGEGIAYAHIDDAFIRAYTIDAERIRLLISQL